MAELRQKYLARAVDKRRSSQYNQEMQVELQSKKKVKRAFFDIIDTHQDPVAGPDSPIPLWRLKLPNSWKHDNWSADEFGSCPAGPGKSSRRIIHKIIEMTLAFPDD